MQQISHAQKRKKPKTRTNIVLSVIIHIVIFAAGAYWAAREGMLGEKLKTISASILEKEKRPEAKKDDAEEKVKKAEVAQEVKQIKQVAAAAAADKFIPPPPAADV